MGLDYVTRIDPVKGKVVLFSGIADDPVYEIIPPERFLRVMDLDDDFAAENEDEAGEAAPLRNLEKLRKTFCIFDDTHQLSSKKAHKALEELASRIYKGGRQLDISIGTTAQTGLRGARTMDILNNAFVIWANPQSTSKHQVYGFLKRYMNLPEHGNVLGSIGSERPG